jgi:hypothetical protein
VKERIDRSFPVLGCKPEIGGHPAEQGGPMDGARAPAQAQDFPAPGDEPVYFERGKMSFPFVGGCELLAFPVGGMPLSIAARIKSYISAAVR